MGEHNFGCCPRCGDDGVILNLGRNHWVYCAKHQIAWWIGSNLFSNWRDESPEEWQKNREELVKCTIIKESGAVYSDEQRRVNAIVLELLDRLGLSEVRR